MNHRHLVSIGLVIFGLLACLEGVARLASGESSHLYLGGKHPWLAGYFAAFGSFAPYASALVSLLIGVFFFYSAYRVAISNRSEGGSQK